MEDPATYTAERRLEDACLRLAKANDGGLKTVDMIDFLRDVVDAAAEATEAGTSKEGVISIIEDALGAAVDKQEEAKVAAG